MICARIHEPLFLHAHEQLRGVPRLVVGYHLRRCPACRAKWARWSREESRWRATLAAEPGVNGGAGKLRSAVAARIGAMPGPATPSSPRSHRSRSVFQLRHHPRTLVVAVVLLTLALNALAVFGPPLAAAARRAWLKATRRPVSCDVVPRVNRTPPGDEK